MAIGWVTVFAQVRSERRDAQDAAITRAQDRATLLEQHVVKTLQVAALASLHLGRVYLTPGVGPTAIADHGGEIHDPAIGIAGVTGVIILDPHGHTIASWGRDDLPSHRPTLANARFTRGDADLVLSNPEPGGDSRHPIVFVTRRIEHGGEFAGTVSLAFLPEQFLNFPLRTRFDKTDLVSVINLNGITLARREGNRFSSGEDVRFRLVMRKQQENPNGTYLGPSSLDGVVRYFSHRRLEDFPLFVTAGVSHSSALASAYRRAIAYFSVMGALSVLGILMAWLVQREAIYRQKKAAELAESTHRLQEAQRVGKIGDWEYDLETGTVIWSDQLCNMYERCPRDDHLSFADFADYLSPEDRERFQRDLEFLLANGGSHSYEFKVVLPSGNVSCRSVNAIASTGRNGTITRLHGTDQDVTHLHLFRELEKQVAHLDRQGAMSMMAGTLAHELNQPLTAASNYLSGSLRAVRGAVQPLAVSVASGMEDALDQIHGAAEIIRRVRRMVQTEAEPTRTARVMEVVHDSIALLSASGFPNAHAIKVGSEGRLPEASIASIQLQQVVMNLLKNALEAVPDEGGAVSLTVRHAADSRLRIEVRDNGPGFAVTQGDAFSAFVSDKTSGMGLGLSISRTIIEYHGGSLQIESSKPGETLVVILLPAATPTDRQ